ncbi:MAG: hypothetical protein SWZ49_26945 [Cyanobacteriota bacterium]|nr:hypothetical protein [Cyanobacteriota bacterium]
MIRKLFQKYLESRPCLTAYNDKEQKEPRQDTHFILFPSNRWFNLTLNHIMDRPQWYKGILHNHPWFNISIILKGGYWERTDDGVKWYPPGSIIFRSAQKYHSIWIEGDKKAWTLFFHGPLSKSFEFKKDNQSVNVEEVGMAKAVFRN